MATQKIILTALPQGATATEARLFVHVSPQLTGAPTLSGFPEWLAWPELLSKAELRITFDGAPPVLVRPKLASGASAAWKTLFKPELRVDGYVFPGYTNRFIHSYPVASVQRHLKNVYQTIGVAMPETPPMAEQMLLGIGTLIPPRVAPSKVSRVLSGLRLPAEPQAALKNLRQYARERKTIPPVVSGLSEREQIQLDFYRSRVFHMAIPATSVPDKQTGQPVARLKPISEKEFADSVDFHKLVALVSDHPILLKLLGLAFEVRVPLPAGTPGGVQVEWVGPPLPTPTSFLSPKTLLTPQLLAQPRPGSEQMMGFLNFAERYELITLDVDSASLKLAQLSEGLGVGERARERGGSEPQSAPLAALRSGGISLVRTGRSEKLAGDLARSAALNAAGATPPPLHADDLTRGWRIDVRNVRPDGSPTSRWQSLCQRGARYKLGGGPGPQDKDEGWVELAVTEQPGNPGDIYLHESLARWNGWSLSVERPGKPVADRAIDGGAPFGVEAQFSPLPGTLPMLRFGRTYQLRARAADLVGEGVTLNDKEEKFVSRPLFYARYEPVAAPFLVLRTPGGEGETPETLVVRSFNDAPAKDTVASAEAAERHAAPPRAAAELCETHGALDDPSGKPRKDLYPTILERHGPRADLQDRAGRIVAEADWSLPYLPDPLALGLAIHGLPTATPGGRESLTLDYGDAKSWPSPKPIRVRLIEGAPRGYRYDPASRVLEIKLPKGDKIHLSVASALTRENLELLQVWKWMAEKLTSMQKSGEVASLASRAMAGRLWMLTPQKELTIVHAVQQPLKAPTITAIRAVRPFSSPTQAEFEGQVTIHGKSTGVVDFTATWEERRDEPGDPTNDPVTQRVKQSAAGFQFHLRFPGDEVPEVADTPILDNESRPTAVYQPGADRLTFVRSSSTATLSAVSRTLVLPKMAFSDTRYRRIALTGRAATRFADYCFDRDVQPSKALTRTAPTPTPVDIPSGARPLAPQVLYAVPTFGWSRTPGQSVRRGGGLRVYLDRPWFSSGDGELLGVVVAAPSLPFGDERRSLVTLLGRDPIWPGTANVNAPGVGSFPRALNLGSQPDAASGPGVIPLNQCPTTNLTLEERSDLTVSIAPHAVEYDPERRLWFCDIEVNTGRAYTPFLRLALARYQPRSMNDCHLSRVVLAEILPLVPDRVLSLVRDPSNIAVTLSGPAPTLRSGARGPGDNLSAMLAAPNLLKEQLAGLTLGTPGVPLNLVEFQLEDAAEGDSDLEWRAVGGALRLSATGTVGGNCTWTGSLALPASDGARPRRRLVVREYESFGSEGKQASLRLCYIETVAL